MVSAKALLNQHRDQVIQNLRNKKKPAPRFVKSKPEYTPRKNRNDGDIAMKDVSEPKEQIAHGDAKVFTPREHHSKNGNDHTNHSQDTHPIEQKHEKTETNQKNESNEKNENSDATESTDNTQRSKNTMKNHLGKGRRGKPAIRLVPIEKKKERIAKTEHANIGKDTFVDAMADLKTNTRVQELATFGIGDDAMVQAPAPTYDQAFFDVLFTNKPLPNTSAIEIVEKKRIQKCLYHAKQLICDGDLMVSALTSKFHDVPVPVLELIICVGMQEWVKGKDMKHKIIFRASSHLFDEVVDENYVVNTEEETVFISSAVDVKASSGRVIRVSDFIAYENVLQTLKDAQETVTNGSLPDDLKLQQTFAKFFSKKISSPMQAREFMMDINDSIMVYDATNVAKKMGNYRKLPGSVYYFCLLQLIQLFANNHQVKKSYFVMDYNAFSAIGDNLKVFSNEKTEVIFEKDRKADEVIVDICKGYKDKMRVVLVSDDQELSWRAPGIIECKVDAWREATLSAFATKYNTVNDAVDKTIHDVLMWYLSRSQKEITSGRWAFKNLTKPRYQENLVRLTKNFLKME